MSVKSATVLPFLEVEVVVGSGGDIGQLKKSERKKHLSPSRRRGLRPFFV
jgi:hypothetical protein